MSGHVIDASLSKEALQAFELVTDELFNLKELVEVKEMSA